MQKMLNESNQFYFAIYNQILVARPATEPRLGLHGAHS